MERVNIIGRSKLPVGKTESPHITMPEGCKGIRLQMSATNAAWNDAERLLTMQIERSLDGGASWEHWLSATVEGAARDKEGNLPSIRFNLTDDNGDSTVKSPFLVRASITLNKSETVGADLDIE